LNMQFSNRQIPAGNPLANALIVIVGALAIGASLILGFVAMIVIGSIVLMMAAIVGIRVWWANRRMLRRAGPGRPKPDSSGPNVIEGEFRVIPTQPKNGERPRQ